MSRDQCQGDAPAQWARRLTLDAGCEGRSGERSFSALTCTLQVPVMMELGTHPHFYLRSIPEILGSSKREAKLGSASPAPQRACALPFFATYSNISHQ